MAKARRKMRRALMKKMKKGSLTPGERRDLMELDREVNKANRQAAGATGAGLGAALAIASKTGALDRAGDSLGNFLDSRAEARGQRRAESADIQEEEERARDQAELSKRASAAEESERPTAKESNRSNRSNRSDREAENARLHGFDSVDEMNAFYKDFYAEGEEDMKDAKRELKEQELADMENYDPYIEAVRDMNGAAVKELAYGPANMDQGVQARRQADLAKRRARKDAEKAQRDAEIENEEILRDQDPALRANRLQNERAETSDDLVIDRDLYSRDQRRQMRRSGFNPETGEYLDSAEQIAADEKFEQDFDQEFPDSEVLAAGLASIDPALPNLAAYNRRQAERFRKSGIPLAQQAGPRVENEYGGYTPFLASMRQKLRKRFR